MSEALRQARRGPAKIAARIASLHSNHRRIAGGALLIGILTLIAKVFVAAREMAIAWRFGVSSTVDAYQLAITATTWLPTMLASVMAVVLVPRLVKVARDGDGASSFRSELNGGVLLVSLIIAGATWAAAPAIAHALASNMNARTTALTSMMIARMAPVAFFTIVAGYLFARLQARERYGYSVSEALPALAIALFVIVPSGLAGPQTLIAGTLVGYLLQFIALGALVLLGDSPIGRVRFRHRSSEWPSLYGSLLLMMAGQLLITASIPIDQGFAARLGEGSVAALGYANRIVTLFSGIGTVVVGRALLPVLSGAVADGDLALGRRQALQWSALLGVGAIFGSLVLWFLAPPLVRLVFERGAFDAASAAQVSNVLRWGVIQLPFYFAGIALVQWYAARGRYRELLQIAAVSIAAKFALNALLVERLGVAGIMAATAGMYLLSFMFQLYGMRK